MTDHRPVLLDQILKALSPRDGGRYLDGTFGAGGYSKALMERAVCRVYAIDRDPAAIAAGQALVKQFSPRLTLIQGIYGMMETLLAEHGVVAVDGVALDIGVSSMQLDQPERGFSFRHDGPLDMRMGDSGPTAADLANKLEEQELADIIFRYGEERQSRRIARALCAARRQSPITRTGQLADLVRRATGGRRANGKRDPATRTFQALRIAVNNELAELERGLAAAERLLSPGGRLAVVSFHSLEDRAVKTFLRERAGKSIAPSRHRPTDPKTPSPTFRLPHPGAIKPSPGEIADNPRARSARLRWAERSDIAV